MRLQTKFHDTLQAHGQRADCDEDMGNFTQVFGASPNKHKARSGPLKGVVWSVLIFWYGNLVNNTLRAVLGWDFYKTLR